jgi:hypothetical protein
MRLTTVAPAMTPSASYKGILRFLAGVFQELYLLLKAKVKTDESLCSILILAMSDISQSLA